eukprot:6176837-Pleurochrysis_carterae.AAC.2
MLNLVSEGVATPTRLQCASHESPPRANSLPRTTVSAMASLANASAPAASSSKEMQYSHLLASRCSCLRVEYDRV